MEHSRPSTSSKRLSRTVNTFIESPEAYITSIPAFRPESFPAGKNRDIPVSVQEMVSGSKAAGVGTSTKSLDGHNGLLSSIEEVHGPRKEKGLSEVLDTHSLQGTSPTDKSLAEKPKHFVRGPEEEVGPRKAKQPSESSPSLHKKTSASTGAKQGQANHKEQSEGQAKGKGKGKIQMEQALPTELQNYKEKGTAMDNVFNMARTLLEFKTRRRKDQANLLQGTKLNNFEYIQQNLGREILQVKESQKNIIGLQNLNKENILSLAHVYARILSKATLLNQPDDNSISFIARQLKELGIQAQNLENSSGHNVGLFREQLEKSEKARLELKDDFQSNINNIALNNELPRQATPILDRNVLNLNNDLHHTISSNAEVETVCNFKDIIRLEEWPSYSGEGEYNHMEFMKTTDFFKEDFNIPDEYISAKLHSLFTKSKKKWYYKMRKNHGKHSWPWWKEQIISKLEDDSCRFEMESSF
ncbi:hypothetical protein O181_052213 [Austropuccinia psidii MF-1]|uniref:Uncharacterized protein n=1 Tax=Austropuccinia psidii MF-1 TaxID=1389203 RepID=A0A9Q3HP45_9BASI|nr:hypothetical protein [Austropuccinia psidii MF-1]